LKADDFLYEEEKKGARDSKAFGRRSIACGHNHGIMVIATTRAVIVAAVGLLECWGVEGTLSRCKTAVVMHPYDIPWCG
jgi:hypothetical protein